MPENTQKPAFPEAFVAPHIQEAQAAAEGQFPAHTGGKGPKSDPKAQEEYTFHFDWTDKRSRRWQGTFRNRVVSIYQKRQIGLMRAHLLGGLPLSSVDPETQALLHMIAWLQNSLLERPKWFEKPDQLDDDLLVAKVFAEVASHEATFHGHDKAEAGSEGHG